MKEYKTTIKYKCGCKKTVTTLNYKPKKKPYKNKVCPHCFMVDLMGKDYGIDI